MNVPTPMQPFMQHTHRWQRGYLTHGIHHITAHSSSIKYPKPPRGGYYWQTVYRGGNWGTAMLEAANGTHSKQIVGYRRSHTPGSSHSPSCHATHKIPMTRPQELPLSSCFYSLLPPSTQIENTQLVLLCIWLVSSSGHAFWIFQVLHLKSILSPTFL